MPSPTAPLRSTDEAGTAALSVQSQARGAPPHVLVSNSLNHLRPSRPTVPWMLPHEAPDIPARVGQSAFDWLLSVTVIRASSLPSSNSISDQGCAIPLALPHCAWEPGQHPGYTGRLRISFSVRIAPIAPPRCCCTGSPLSASRPNAAPTCHFASTAFPAA